MLSTVRTLDLKHFENVKTVFEHVSLYVGLVVYTAAGAKVMKLILIQSVLMERICYGQTKSTFVEWPEKETIFDTFSFLSKREMKEGGQE